MLFDLSSPGRKRVIRVVYGILALLFFVGFVGFGIGTDAGIGGLFDTLQRRQRQLDLRAVRAADRGRRGQARREPQRRAGAPRPDPVPLALRTGPARGRTRRRVRSPGVSEESRQEFEAAIAAWNRYLETDPAKPDVTSANSAVQAYNFLGDFGGAAEAQEILAEANPSAGAYGQLAYFYYADLNFKAGEAAAEQAVAEAKPAQKKAVEKQLAQLQDAAEKLKKQQEKLPDSATGEGELTDPFGGLDPGGGTVPPTTP